MKKWFCLFFAAALLFASCDSLPFITEDSDTAETNPDNDDPVDDPVTEDDPPVFTSPMGTPGQLPPSGASAAPVDEAEAVDMLNMALAELLNSNPGDAPGGGGGDTASVRSTLNDTIWFYWTDFLGGGTVDFEGQMSISISYDDDFMADPDSYYINFLTYFIEADFTGDAEGVTISDGSNDYLVNGSILSSLEFGMDCDMLTGPEGESFDVFVDYDIEMDYEFGLAFSVLRNDGVGAKFILSHTAEFEEDNITDDLIGEGDVFTFLPGVTPAVLYVFSDDDELIAEYEITPDKLSLFSMGMFPEDIGFVIGGGEG